MSWFQRLSLTAARIFFGALFLASGLGKLLTGWSAAAYLEGVNGPLAGWFNALSGSGFVDGLNAWGQLLIGLALVLGLGVRAASFFGVILMALYYLAGFAQNTTHGLIEEHVIYALLFVVLAAFSAGNVFGLSSRVASSRWGKSRKWLRFVL